ncbi:MAG: heavy-metal-associated domain-containing protein [Elusimicrobia bacterium]|nr:heavy-metal-associated domain-containing protein [Elusimicrobiota bacterium]
MKLRKKLTVIWTLFLFLPTWFGHTAEPADSKLIKINVKGLTCPFCAYGLEKRLQETGADNVKINVDKGQAQISYTKQNAIDFNQLKEAVKKGGFTPGTIEMNAKGSLNQKDGRWTFKLADSEDLFLVKKDEVSEKMINEIKEGITVRVSAKVGSELQEGHSEHPATLKILSYEKVK